MVNSVTRLYWPEQLKRLGLERNSRLVRLLLLGALDATLLLLALVIVLPWRADTEYSDLLILSGILLFAQFAAGYATSLYDNRYRIGSGAELRWQALVFVIVAFVGIAATAGFSVHLRQDALILTLFVGTALMVGARQLLRVSIDHNRRPHAGERVVIVGASEVASSLISQMLRGPANRYRPAAIVDDDPATEHLIMDGVPVRGRLDDLGKVIEQVHADGAIIAIAQAPREIFRSVVDQIDLSKTWVRTLPPFADLINSDIGLSSVRDIDVSDLLGRTVQTPGTASLTESVRDRTVLVTGAGGSIGSELCRIIARQAPARLVMLDRDESALHSLCMSLEGRALMDSPDLALADIRDFSSLEQVFFETKPDVVFHTAALKHLPMLETFPQEGWKTNVYGTLNVLKAAQRYGVERFVNISTDKAADPTSNLGRTKLLAERLTASFAATTGKHYVSVRFGNVLGSRGSVLIAFQEQIRQGLPLTVTHPDVTRYFMTIPEACLLIVEASVEGGMGETLVLDMGQPVRIIDIAQRMMALSGRGCPIVYTGLRDGEKLHEQLFSPMEGGVVTDSGAAWHTHVTPLAPSELPDFDISGEEIAAFHHKVIAPSRPWAESLHDTTVESKDNANVHMTTATAKNTSGNSRLVGVFDGDDFATYNGSGNPSTVSSKAYGVSR